MNQNIKLSNAISYIIVVVAVLLFLCIWPGEFIQQKYVSKSNEIIAMESDPVNVERNVTQMFVSEGGELSAVELYVCNDMRGETITFRLYDSGYNEIFNSFFVVKEKQEIPGFVHIPVRYDLVKDQQYYFTLEGLSADMIVAYEDRETSTSIVNGFMSYGGVEIQRYNVVIRYEYKNPFVWWQIMLIGAVTILVAVGVCAMIRKLFSEKVVDRDVKVQNILRVVLNPVIAIGGLILLLIIFPGRKIGRDMWDHVFYFGGVFLLIVELLFIINFKREGNRPLIDFERLKKKWPEYLQSVCVAAVIWYCYEYLNGLYEIHHSLATRKMLIWFFLGLVCTYSKKELLRSWNLGYLAVSGVVAYLQIRQHLGMGEEEELFKLEAGLLVIGCFVVWLLVINVIQCIRRRETPLVNISIGYVLLFVVLLGSMIVFRNGRNWLIVMAVVFAIFYLRMWLWDKRDRIIPVTVNGLIFNFIYMVGYSLMHRPYQRFVFARYGLGFHTVTMASVYLSLVVSVIVVKFLNKYYQEKKLINAWPEFALLCITNAYLIMTLSRTGYLAAAAAELVAVILMAIKNESGKGLCIVKSIGVIAIVSLLAFPTVFTMTRIIPAVVNDPILSEVELTGYEVKQGMPLNSKYYMRVEKFLEMVGVKLVRAHEDARLYLNPWDIRVIDDSVMLVSADDDIIVDSSINNISNGRIDIFKEYIANWNLNGHEDMSVTQSDGTVIVHAHNVFLQVIHDHGLPTGILFILFGVVSFVMALVRFYKRNDMNYAFVLTVIVAFAVSGLVEWNFHLCQPFGIALFMILTPLLFNDKDIVKNEQ